MDDGTPHTEFRFATDEEAARLAAEKNGPMQRYVNLDGWLHGYFNPTTRMAYYLDTTTDRWIVPEGDWSAKEPMCLASDAAQWSEHQ